MSVQEGKQRRASGPWWVKRLDAQRVVVHADGEQVIDRCEPPLPASITPGFSVTFIGEDTRTRVRLFPVPGAPELFLGVADSWVVELSSAFMEELVNHIAHDLRNLTFTASLQAEIAHRQAQPAKPYLDSILAQLGKVQGYLERLLLYGRKPRLSLANLNVEAFVQEKLRAIRQSWPPDRPPLSFRLSIPENVGVARWDPHFVGAALDAVLSNAAEATPAGGEVEVAVIGTDEEVTLEVRDAGPGIPPEVLPRVFFPMVARRPQGMGLGLPTAKKLVEAHGGRLELATSPQGTTVRLVLPREAHEG